jgi:hypothetical protein
MRFHGKPERNPATQGVCQTQRVPPGPETLPRLAFRPRTQPRQPITPQLQRLRERLHQPSLRQVLFEHAQRQQRHAGTGGGRAGQRQRRIKHRPARFQLGHASSLQPLRPLITAVGAQQCHAGQVARLPQRPRQCRRAHRCERRRQHRGAHLALPVAIAEADRQVQPFAGQVDAVVVGLQAQLDIGVPCVEVGQPRQQPTGGERAHYADAEHFAEMPAHEPVQAHRDAVEGLVQHRIQARPFVGQGHPSRQPVEQHRSQPLFQPTDLVTQRSLAHAQLQRGAGEVLMARGGLEGTQRVERELGTKHGRVVRNLDG